MVSVFVNSVVSSEKDAPYHRKVLDNRKADWDGFCDHLRDIPWNDIYKYGPSKAVSKFSEWLQVGVGPYIPNCKYQVKHHSSPWFSPSCAAAIAHRNHFYIFIKEINRLCLIRLCLGKLVIVIKGLLDLLRIAIPRRQRNPLFHRGLALLTFGMLLTVF